MTFGIAESALSKMIEKWEDALPPNMHLAYLPNQLTGVKLRLSAYDAEDTAIEREISALRALNGEYIYSEKETSLQECIGDLLKSQGKTKSTAETRTGGTIAQLMTSIPGSSEYFLGGVVSYANSVKTDVLNVPAEIIEKHGAVSSECVAAMAEGVRILTGSDYSVATSGIAGPGGGSPEKPVGLVWVGVSSAAGTDTYKVQYRSSRSVNIERFAAFALNQLRKIILSTINSDNQVI